MGRGLCRRLFQSRPGEIHRTVRCDPRLQIVGVYDLPFGKGQPWLRKARPRGSSAVGAWPSSPYTIAARRSPSAARYSCPSTPAAQRARGPLRHFLQRMAPQTKAAASIPARTISSSLTVPAHSRPRARGTALNGIGNDTRYNPKLRLFPEPERESVRHPTFPIREALHVDIPRGSVQCVQPGSFWNGIDAAAKPEFRHADRLRKPDQLAAPDAVRRQAVLLDLALRGGASQSGPRPGAFHCRHRAGTIRIALPPPGASFTFNTVCAFTRRFSSTESFGCTPAFGPSA